MKYLSTTLLLLLTAATYAQTPQIARVSNKGTTTLYNVTGLKAAMSAARDGDIIYLPGGLFGIDSLIFQHNVTVIGAGHSPDSTQYTGRTIISGTVYVYGGASGGSLQGVALGAGGDYAVLFNQSCQNFNFTIAKCYFNGTGYFGYSYSSTNSTLTLTQCVLGSLNNEYVARTNNAANTMFNIYATNCIITTVQCSNSNFINCLIWTTSNCVNNNYQNCVLRTGFYYSDYSTFINCHVESNTSLPSISYTSLQYNTTYDATTGSTFVGGAMPSSFSYTFNFHVKSTSAAAGSGIDGTDKGIYGSQQPYNPNPSNPHIYFKNIAQTTNPQGQLQVNVKVAAQ